MLAPPCKVIRPQGGTPHTLRNTAVDETWLYYCDSSIKQQNGEWRHPSSPNLKKAKTVKSAGKSHRKLDYIRASRGSHMPEIIFKIIQLLQHPRTESLQENS
ncbi:hypothetical protein TNCV_4850921 [Trichonephila clavipes]|nr:hypothetical protein TNCV_4850921 [Trichonephila clavipes]